MKVHFGFRHYTYFAQTKEEAIKFLLFWGENGNVYPFKTNWNITSVERGPGWALRGIDFENKIEYGKKVAV